MPNYGDTNGGAGLFSIGQDEVWPGPSKLIEECGEVLQIAGKLIATGGRSEHWSGLDLRAELQDELADLAAATQFVADHNELSDRLYEANETINALRQELTDARRVRDYEVSQSIALRQERDRIRDALDAVESLGHTIRPRGHERMFGRDPECAHCIAFAATHPGYFAATPTAERPQPECEPIDNDNFEGIVFAGATELLAEISKLLEGADALRQEQDITLRQLQEAQEEIDALRQELDEATAHYVRVNAAFNLVLAERDGETMACENFKALLVTAEAARDTAEAERDRLREALLRIMNEMVATPEDAGPYFKAVAAAALIAARQPRRAP